MPGMWQMLKKHWMNEWMNTSACSFTYSVYGVMQSDKRACKLVLTSTLTSAHNSTSLLQDLGKLRQMLNQRSGLKVSANISLSHLLSQGSLRMGNLATVKANVPCTQSWGFWIWWQHPHPSWNESAQWTGSWKKAGVSPSKPGMWRQRTLMRTVLWGNRLSQGSKCRPGCWSQRCSE